jgi:hypothetical protein
MSGLRADWPKLAEALAFATEDDVVNAERGVRKTADRKISTWFGGLVI